MIRTPLKEIADLLQSFSLPPRSTVIIHSSLLRLGLIERGLSGLLEVVEEWLGPDATLVMPAFTFSFPQQKIWKSHDTPAETGAFTEYFRKLPGVVRTLHPIHSVCARGRQAKELERTFCRSSFGEGSAFHWLLNHDAWNLSIGTEFEGGATYLHCSEEMRRVPYRFYKEFPGEVFDASGQQVAETFSMYARIVTPEYQYMQVWDGLWTELNRAGVFQIASLKAAPFYLSRIQAGHQVFSKLLLKDPFYTTIMKPNTK